MSAYLPISLTSPSLVLPIIPCLTLLAKASSPISFLDGGICLDNNLPLESLLPPPVVLPTSEALSLSCDRINFLISFFSFLVYTIFSLAGCGKTAAFLFLLASSAFTLLGLRPRLTFLRPRLTSFVPPLIAPDNKPIRLTFLITFTKTTKSFTSSYSSTMFTCYSIFIYFTTHRSFSNFRNFTTFFKLWWISCFFSTF